MMGEKMNNLCIAIFTNRTHTLSFYAKLRSFGIVSKIRNMPKGLGSSCGLVVEFPFRDLQRAKALIMQMRLSSFKHIYLNNSNFEYKLIV